MKRSNFKLFAAMALLSGSVSAGTMGPTCSPLCAMTSAGGFYASGTLYGLVPSESGMGLFTDSWLYASSDGDAFALSKPARPEYDVQGGVSIGYDLPGTANNIELSYTRLRSDTRSIRDTSDNPIAFGSAFFNLFIPLAPGQEFVSDSHLRYDLDQVDLIAGRWYNDTSGPFQLHPFAGVRYANLEHDLSFLTGHVRTSYDGAGPLLGMDGRYELGRGFGLAGRVDAAVMMGRVKSDSQIILGATFDYITPKIDRVVSVVDGRLGVDYTHIFANQASLKLELGYHVSEFFNPFDIILAESPPAQKIRELQTTNFSYSGPYLSFTVHA